MSTRRSIARLCEAAHCGNTQPLLLLAAARNSVTVFLRPAARGSLNGILPASGSLLSQSMFVINKNLENPSVITWNFAVERGAAVEVGLDFAYLGCARSG